MKKLLSSILTAVITLFFFSMPLHAAEKNRTEVNILHEFNVNKAPDEVIFELKREAVFDDVTLPGNSIITAQTLESQKERRWHKSGFIVLHVKSYEPPFEEKINVEDKDIYLIAKKFKPIDPKEAAIIGTELAAAFSASYFIPGIDIAYFFTKGAILRKKHPNWFRAGVSNVYDNSIFWFCLKGKPIDLEENADVSIKEIKKERAYKLKSQIEKRKARQLRREQRRQLRKERRRKHLQNNEIEQQTQEIKMEVKAEVNTDAEVQTETKPQIDFELAPKIQSVIKKESGYAE